MSAVASPIGAVTFSFSEESVLNGPPGQWVNPSALLHSSHTEPLTRPVCRVFFALCPIESYLWTLVRSAAADIDSRSQCADASRSVPVRAVRVRRVHGLS